MIIGEVAKRIFECPKNKRDDCPLAKKFYEINGKLPIPEAYAGNSKAKFMIVGINPGQDENYLPEDFDEYQKEIEGFLEAGRLGAWQYSYATEIFRYPYPDGVLITNVVHCPTSKWKLNNEEKKSIELCNKFCFEIIEEVDPELILLHGLDVAKLFGKYYNWDLPENPKSKDINGIIKEGNGRKFVLSQHCKALEMEKTKERGRLSKKRVKI